MANYSDRNTAGTIRRFGRPNPDAPRPALSNALENEHFLQVYCLECQHGSRPVDPRPIAAKYGATWTLHQLAPLFVCTKCGVRGRVEFRLTWPPGYPTHNTSIRPYEWWDAQPARDVLARMKSRGPS